MVHSNESTSCAQDVIEIVEDGYEESTSKEAEAIMPEVKRTTLRANKKKDCKTKSILYQGLDDTTFEILTLVNKSKDVQEILQKTHKSVDMVKKIHHQKGEFEVLLMIEVFKIHCRLLCISQNGGKSIKKKWRISHRRENLRENLVIS